MITQKEFQQALDIVKQYKIQIEKQIKDIEKETNYIPKLYNVSKKDKLYGENISTRLYCVLKRNKEYLGITFNDETKISDLSKVSLKDFSSLFMVGKKTVEELKDLCFHAGVKLKP